jgi:hypothetical protein
MFLRCNRRKKDGKTHDYWSVVENRRCSDGRVVQRQVLSLGEINASQREAWRKTIELQDAGTRRQVALFQAGSMPVDDVDAIGVRLSELSLRRPRQWGACWLALQLWQQLELDSFWRPRFARAQGNTPWLKVLKTLVAYRLVDPGSEWRLHRQWFDASAPGHEVAPAGPCRPAGLVLRAGREEHAVPLPGSDRRTQGFACASGPGTASAPDRWAGVSSSSRICSSSRAAWACWWSPSW